MAATAPLVLAHEAICTKKATVSQSTSLLHGCRNLCILQPCWFEGCNRWQRPRLLLLLMKPSVPKRPLCPSQCSPARLPQSVHPTTMLVRRVQQMAATAPSALAPEYSSEHPAVGFKLKFSVTSLDVHIICITAVSLVMHILRKRTG